MDPISSTAAVSPTAFSVSRARAPRESPSVLVVRNTIVDALTTVAANSAAMAVPMNAGRCARSAARASPVLISIMILRRGGLPP